MADCWASFPVEASSNPEFGHADPYFSNQGEAGTCVRHALAKALQYRFEKFVSKAAYRKDESPLKACCVDPSDSLETLATVSVLVNELSSSGAKGTWPEAYDGKRLKLVGRKGKVYELQVSVKPRQGPCREGDVVVLAWAKYLGIEQDAHSRHALFCQEASSDSIRLRNSWGKHMEWVPIERDHEAVDSTYEVEVTKLVQQKIRGPDEEFLAAAKLEYDSTAKPGLNIRGKCTREGCPANGRMTWCNLSTNASGENLLLMPGRCSLCGAGLENGGVELGFCQCSWEISGCYDAGHGKPVDLTGRNLEGTASGADVVKTWPIQGSALNYRKFIVKTW